MKILLILFTQFSLAAPMTCPDQSGVYDCPAFQLENKTLEAYRIYMVTTKSEGTSIYSSFVSAGDNGSKIVADGKQHSSIDHKGQPQTYKSFCNQNVRTVEFKKSGKAVNTKSWLDKNGSLNIKYSWAKNNKVQVCKKVGSIN